MTYAEKEEMFSKDVLTIEDIEKLLCMGYDEAAKKIREIKKELNFNQKYNGQGVRISAQGKLHVQDYFDYFRITDHTRYSAPSVVVGCVE